MDPKAHWEERWAGTPPEKASWYQRESTLSLELIARAAPDLASSIIDVGGGASTLVDSLFRRGYRHLTVLDLSARALAAARRRLGANAAEVRWLEADVLRFPFEERSFDVWHDRAVFHFLLAAADRRTYVEQARRAIRPGGSLVMATFAEDGPSRCSGLPVARYGPAALASEFATDFALVEDRREEHRTPSGGRQMFTYVSLERLG